MPENSFSEIMNYKSPFGENSSFSKEAVIPKLPKIISVKIKENPPFKYGETITIVIESENLSGSNLVVSLWDDDTAFGLGKDTLLWKKTVMASNKFELRVKLTEEMKNKAHHTRAELGKAEYYCKVESSASQVSDKFSKTFKVVNEIYQEEPDYYGQIVNLPDGRREAIHQDAIAIDNENGQTIAFLLPDETLFIWVDETKDPSKRMGSRGFFKDGRPKNNNSYMSYVLNKKERKENPISWGIYLAATDSGDSVIKLVEDPVETSIGMATGLAKLFYKIVTLDFDISKTWERIRDADLTDASYVVSAVLLAYLAGPKGLKKIPVEDLNRFKEVVEEVVEEVATTRSARLTWPELLALFRVAKEFEARITRELLRKYPVADGWIHVEQLYLKGSSGVTSIVDNVIYNPSTQKFILNETKYGRTNILRKNQKAIFEDIKMGNELEIRSKGKDDGTHRFFSQDNKIKIDEVLRSHSVDGTIIDDTIQSIWK